MKIAHRIVKQQSKISEGQISAISNAENEFDKMFAKALKSEWPRKDIERFKGLLVDSLTAIGSEEALKYLKQIVNAYNKGVKSED